MSARLPQTEASRVVVVAVASLHVVTVPGLGLDESELLR